MRVSQSGSGWDGADDRSVVPGGVGHIERVIAWISNSDYERLLMKRKRPFAMTIIVNNKICQYIFNVMSNNKE